MTERRIVATGASGLIGRALTQSLRERGDEVITLGRGGSRDDVPTWDPASGTLDPSILEGVDAVVNLNGAGVGDKRWTDERKRVVRDSRIEPTRLLAETMATLESPPPVFISASAMGYYGDTGDDAVDESAPPGNDFLAQLCVDWEAEAEPARRAGIRVVHPRTGIVLSRNSAALTPLLPLFRLGVGGPIGDGNQWWSWITIGDVVAALEFCIDHEIAGPANLTAPNPVRNREFARALGRQLHRPASIPVPKIAVRIRLGRELAEAIGYGSQRVLPTALLDAGYEFRSSHLDEGLARVFEA